MLSDEEMKAIESLKNIAIYMGDNYTFSQQGIRNLRENLRIVLPAIKKQSKEIEELREENNTTIVLEANRRNYDRVYNLGKIYTNKKWEDKIKAKIEEIEKIIEFEKPTYEDVLKYAIEVLQSLLERRKYESL